VLLFRTPAAPCAAEWRRLDSPNFIVIGDVGASTLKDIAVKFEGFRETLGGVLSSQVTATAVPTVVVVFLSDRASSLSCRSSRAERWKSTVCSSRDRTVEFITHRDELAGSVGCGPVKGPPEVYVTWRADGPGKRAVAVEFLPQ
jgi:hypothetical protein